MQLRFFLEFFKLPRIVLTIAFTFILFFFFRNTNDKTLAAGIVQVVFLLSFFAYWLLVYRKEVRLNIDPDKKFLLHDCLRIWKNTPFIFAMMLPGMIFAISKFFQIQDKFVVFNYIITELMVSFTITLYGIMAILSGIYMPRRIKDDIHKEFPQFCS